MTFSKKCALKFYQIRHQNWSAPAIMSVFIIICMIVIYSFESIGLLHKEKNLVYRIKTPEKMIKTIDQEISAGSQIEKKDIYENEQIVLEKIKLIEEKYKEKNQEQILSILVSGLNQQMQYENKINSQNQTNEEKEQYEDIYDI